MPKELSELKKAQEALEAKRADFEKWVKSQEKETADKVLAILKAEPSKVFTPQELAESIFGKKKCELKGKEAKEPPPGHEFDCDLARYSRVMGEVFQYIAQTGQVAVYQFGNEFWLGIAEKIR